MTLATHAVSMIPSPLLLLDLLDVVKAEADQAIKLSSMICFFYDNMYMYVYMYQCACIHVYIYIFLSLYRFLLLWRVHRDMLVGYLILLMYSSTFVHA